MAKNLTEGNMTRTFLGMAIPLIAGALLTQAFHMIDTVTVGQILGDDGIAAVGGTSSLIKFITSLFWGFGTGCSLRVATLYGSGDFARARSVARFCIGTVLLSCLAVSLLCVGLTVPLFHLLKIQGSVWDRTRAYYIVYMLGLCFIAAQSSICYVFHALGDSLIPLLLSIVSSVLNVAGNVLFLLFTPLDVAGVALSSALSAVIAVAGGLFFLRRTFRKIGAVRAERLGRGEVKRCLSLGIPCMFQQSALYLSGVVVQPAVNVISTLATAGYTVAMNVYSVTAAVFQNSSKVISSYVAQCIGSRKYDRVSKCAMPGFLQATLLTLPLVLVSLVFPEGLFGLFFRSDSAGALAFALRYVPICTPFLVFAVLTNLFHSFYRGAGAMRYLVLCTVLYTVARICFSYLFVGLGIDGIYLALGLSWVVEGTAAVAIYFSGRWKPEPMLLFEKEKKEKAM